MKLICLYITCFLLGMFSGMLIENKYMAAALAYFICIYTVFYWDDWWDYCMKGWDENG